MKGYDWEGPIWSEAITILKRVKFYFNTVSGKLDDFFLGQTQNLENKFVLHYKIHSEKANLSPSFYLFYTAACNIKVIMI